MPLFSRSPIGQPSESLFDPLIQAYLNQSSSYIGQFNTDLVPLAVASQTNSGTASPTGMNVLLYDDHASGTIAEMTGVYISVTTEGTAPITFMAGVWAQPESLTGTVADSVDYYSQGPFNNPGTVTRNTSYWVDSGFPTTELLCMGFRSSLAAAANVFALFLEGTAKSYINGPVGIGTQTPTAPLQVVGLQVFANNAAAVAGGLTAGAFYRTGADPDTVCVVH